MTHFLPSPVSRALFFASRIVNNQDLADARVKMEAYLNPPPPSPQEKPGQGQQAPAKVQ